jgi:uncharacterized protein (TIGR03435 family)
MGRLITIAVVMLGLLEARPPAQDVRSQFEVASIKPNKSGDFRRNIGPGPGGFSALNVTLREMLPMAYGIPQALAGISIVGGPAWADTERFDIDARTVGDRQPAERIGQMLRALLEDRFQLKAHKETRELPIYALVVAEPDRSFGPRFKAAAYDCAARYAALARKATPEPLPAPDAKGRRACSGQFRPGSIFSTGFDMDWLASNLAPFVSRVVVNRTGLSGGFDFDLEWTPDQRSIARPDLPELSIDPNGPSIFTALREQLGLKLESGRGPVDVVVIDSVEHPTPN